MLKYIYSYNKFLLQKDFVNIKKFPCKFAWEFYQITVFLIMLLFQNYENFD